MNPDRIILHIPHSSYFIPEFLKEDLLVNPQELREDFLAFTDWRTKDLFSCGDFGNRVVYPVSRMVCDPERFRSDDREDMAQLGIGAVYLRDAFLRPLRRFDAVKRELLLRLYYDPHHRRLEQLVGQKLHQHGQCLLLDCHSFSGDPLPYEPAQKQSRPDFCLGTFERHTPAPLLRRAVGFLQGCGFRVALDYPYAGSMLPLRYWDDFRAQTMMIEVNRSLYSRGWQTLPRQYGAIKNVLHSLMQLLAS